MIRASVIADMSIFGHCPAHDDFYLVVCNHCSQVVKPQAFQKHCGEGGPREELEGTREGGMWNCEARVSWEVMCVLEGGLGERKVLGVEDCGRLGLLSDKLLTDLVALREELRGSGSRVLQF